MQAIADKQLPPSMAYDWTELTYLQLQAGHVAIYVFVLGVVFVFLVLAAQYESWSLPLAVILVVPMCLLCSVTGAIASGTDVNIFTQIGFVVLVGLAGKNAILIVEFAKQQSEQGHSRREAALNASRLRLRPILMTSLGVHLRGRPVGAGPRRRRRDAPRPWHRRLFRHARGHLFRHLSDAGLFLRHSMVQGAEARRRSSVAERRCRPHAG